MNYSDCKVDDIVFQATSLRSYFQFGKIICIYKDPLVIVEWADYFEDDYIRADIDLSSDKIVWNTKNVYLLDTVELSSVEDAALVFEEIKHEKNLMEESFAKIKKEFIDKINLATETIKEISELQKQSGMDYLELTDYLQPLLSTFYAANWR